MRPETIESLKELYRSGQLEDLAKTSLTEWKDVCVTKMVNTGDMKPEDMGVLASEMKYGVKAINWLFSIYIGNKVSEKKKPKVDNEDE